MKSFEEDELQFLVANIRQDTGQNLADTHRVGHVTLLLFDAEGKRQGTLVGVSSSKNLASSFRRHIVRHGPRTNTSAN